MDRGNGCHLSQSQGVEDRVRIKVVMGYGYLPTDTISFDLRVFVHAPLSMSRWLPNRPIAIVALEGLA